jgi:hypothetical protein
MFHYFLGIVLDTIDAELEADDYNIFFDDDTPPIHITVEEPIIENVADLSYSGLSIGDCVLVNVRGKKKSQKYAAKIEEFDKNNNELKVNFLKPIFESKK